MDTLQELPSLRLGEYRMYRKRTFHLMVSVLLFGFTTSLFAGAADDQYAVAARHYSRARWELAVDEFTTFLDQYPDHARAGDVTFFLAESLVQLGRFDEARARFASYNTGHPGGRYARRARFRVGEAAYLAGNFNEARRDLQRFWQEYPEDALNGYALGYLGEIALDAEQAEKAHEYFAQALKQFPDGPLTTECRFGLGRALEMLGETNSALQFFRYVASQNTSPLRDDAQLQLAILLYRQQQYESSAEASQEFVERFPGSDLSAHAAYWLGMSQLALGRWTAAAGTLKAAASEYADHPLSAAIHFSAGEAYRQAGDATTAAAFYEKVVESWPDSRWSDDSLQTLAQLSLEMNEPTRAAEWAQAFQERYPDSPLAPTVKQMVGRAALKQGQFDVAIAVFQSLIADEADAADEPTQRQTTKMHFGDEPSSDEPSNGDTEVEEPAADPANEYYLALSFLGAGRFEDALRVLDRLDTAKGPPQLLDGAQVARASAYIGLKQYAKAIEPLHAYLNSQPEGPDAAKCKAQLAVALARLGKWDEAAAAFYRMRDDQVDATLYLPAVQYMAEAAYGAERRELARELFAALAEDNNPDEFVARGLSGLAWLQWTDEGASGQSVATFERLLQEHPDNPLAAEAAMMRGRGLEKQNQKEAAVAMYQLVIDRYPESPHVPNAMLAAARVCDDLERDHEAEQILRALMDQFPDFSQTDAALYQLAWVLVDLERGEQADQLFDRMRTEFMESKFWADATYRLAVRAAQAKQNERAEELARELVSADCEPRIMSHALYLVGQMAAASEQWSEVVVAMERLVQDFPGSTLRIPAEYWRAESHYRQGEYEKAGELFTELQRMTHGRSDAWLAMVPLRRAQVLAQQAAWTDALEVAKGIGEQYPNFRQQYEVDYLLGRAFASRAEFDKAREAYERVIRSPVGGRSETAAMAQWMIGETHFLQKKYTEAIKAYHRVEGLYAYPQWQSAGLLQAGKCHEMLGQWKDAISLYSQIIKDYQETDYFDEASRRLRVAQQRSDITATRTRNQK
jgi:TolA-binding protein